jgi:hypothetical protein
MKVASYQATIYMAGSPDRAKQHLREECYGRGLCVTVSPTTFIYTGGEEEGIQIGLVNYPRFPSTPDEIFGRAVNLALSLVRVLCQKTALVVATDRTEWIQVMPPGARQ